MKVVVVVEAVPDPKQVRISQSQGVAVTAGVPIIASAGSRDALAAALMLREGQDGEIVAVCAGAPDAEDALRQIMAAGADAGYLCADPALTDPDSAVTAKVLVEAIRHLAPFDLVLAGPGEVGPRLAEALDLPQITRAVAPRVAGDAVRARRKMDGEWVEVELNLPALVCVAPNPARPPAPMTGIVAAYREKPFTVWSPGDLGLAEDQLQPAIEIRRTSAASQAKEKLEGAPEEVARQLARRLQAAGWT